MPFLIIRHKEGKGTGILTIECMAFMQSIRDTPSEELPMRNDRSYIRRRFYSIEK